MMTYKATIDREREAVLARIVSEAQAQDMGYPSMSRFTALLDANVLSRGAAGSAVATLAVTDLFRERWTASIRREWIEALRRNEPGAGPRRAGTHPRPDELL